MDGFTVIAVLNGGIALAYLVMAIFLAPRLGLPRAGRLAAIAFFLACAYAQVAVGIDTLEDRHDHSVAPWMFAVNAIQLVVGWALIGVLLRRSEVRIARRLPRHAAARLGDRAGAGWTWSARRDRLHAAPELARMVGQPESWSPRLEGLLALVVPDDRAAFEDQLRTLRRHHGTVRIECRVRRPDGTVRHLLTRAESSRARVTGITEDVTEEREVAAAREAAEREHRIAQTLQRSLLPARLPDVPALELAARYLPGGDGGEVGGDWYDVIELADGDVALVMGDVVGRGIPAAALVGKLRNALRAYVVEGHAPEDALERLNALVDRPAQEMATVLLARYTPRTGAVRWASAGHPPALLRRADGSRSFLDGGRSVPLGALSHVRFEAEEATLAPGDMVMLYTDGLVERRGVPLDESLELLRSSAVRNGSATALCDTTVAALLPEGTEADDVAVLTALVRAPEPVLELDVPARPEALAPMRTRLRAWLREQEVEPALGEPLLVAVNEAATNAVEHAYGPGEAAFVVTAGAARGRIEVTVRDFGRWRPPSAHPPTHDGGRGLLLMRELADSVHVDTDDEGTRVRMEWQR